MIEQTMKCVEIREPGGPDVLILAERNVPVAGAGEILVKVASAGVNRPDVIQRKGLYPPPPGASDLLGLEISGEVVARGEGVANLSVGDQICALTNGGAMPSIVLFRQNSVYPFHPV